MQIPSENCIKFLSSLKKTLKKTSQTILTVKRTMFLRTFLSWNYEGKR